MSEIMLNKQAALLLSLIALMTAITAAATVVTLMYVFR